MVAAILWFFSSFSVLIYLSYSWTESFFGGLLCAGVSILWKYRDSSEYSGGGNTYYHYHESPVSPVSSVSAPSRARGTKKRGRESEWSGSNYGAYGIRPPFGPAICLPEELKKKKNVSSSSRKKTSKHYERY